MIAKVVSGIRRRGYLIFLFKAPQLVLSQLFSRILTLLYKCHLSNCGPNVAFHHSCYIQNPSSVSIGKDVRIGRKVIIKSEIGSSRLTIGNNVRINDNVIIDYTGNISIGSNVTISEGSVIYSHSHGVDPRSSPIGFSKVIGDFVWIGFRSMIMEKCRTIGDSSIVGVGSLLLEDVESRTIVGGNPARTIKRL